MTLQDTRTHIERVLDTIDVAVIYQAFYECKHGTSDARNDAYNWLNKCGQSIWESLGLEPELFDKAYDLWVPKHLDECRKPVRPKVEYFPNVG